MTLLSRTFRSLKRPNLNPNLSKPTSSLSTNSDATLSGRSNSKSKSKPWSVYLILSTNSPIKTYVGVTTNFSRRLKQHNGEIKGGAKAALAGRPWVCACLIQGFEDQSQACAFESKWKTITRKLPYKRGNDDKGKQNVDSSNRLLQHRQLALNKVKGQFDCSQLSFEWKLNPS